jgi:CDP-diacylglycerol--serine O-phosphatidyltransferase
MIKQLPNLLTLLNLFSGCIATVSIFNERYEVGLIAIGCSLFFDYFDGWVARLIKVSNPLGKQLDSLADIVSFGFVPGVIYYYFLNDMLDLPENGWKNLVPISGFIFTLFAALRLARFNLDTRQSNDFVGMPTPAASLFPAGLLWLRLGEGCPACDPILINPFTIIISLVALCGLMVSNLRLFSLKFKGFKCKDNEIKWIYIIFCLLILVVLKEGAVATAVILYVILSLFYKPANGD